MYKLRTSRTKWFGITADFPRTLYEDNYFSFFFEFTRTIVSNQFIGLNVGALVGFRNLSVQNDVFTGSFFNTRVIYDHHFQKYEWGGVLVEMPILSIEKRLALFVKGSLTFGRYYNSSYSDWFTEDTYDKDGLAISPEFSIIGSFRVGK